jgi:beta-lactamase class D
MKLLRHRFIALFALTLLPAQLALAQEKWTGRPEWGQHFRKAKVGGSFLLYDLNLKRYSAYNTKRARTRFIPASTYKILNSLIALEANVVADEKEVIRWDGVKREFPDWNKDHNMRQAMKNSTVWFYQELARRIGKPQMQEYVHKVGYGNRNIGGGIDQFWLRGDLRISSPEQIQLLVRLHQNRLPFAQRSMNIVKDILILERNANSTFRGKTGWAFDNKPQIGWFVGYVQKKNNAYFFALNIDVLKPADIPARISVTKSILRAEKILN